MLALPEIAAYWMRRFDVRITWADTAECVQWRDGSSAAPRRDDSTTTWRVGLAQWSCCIPRSRSRRSSR